ncbi:DUF2460 domain-containing protein [Litorivivens sp.]|uniref:DUF2460 domain-containing protein n=1 Tax=Litorivivens sp. TaxID=2020868 RepID=UPI003563C74B
MAFLEERISEQFSFGASAAEGFDVDLVGTYAGNEYRNLRHPYPRLMLDLPFDGRTETFLYDGLVDIYRRSGGRFGGFRWKNPSDYSTSGRSGTPTYNDQACTLVSAGVYQLTKWYGTEGAASATRRRLLKPVSGSVLVGIRDDYDNPVQITATGVSPERWTVDTTTGKITFAANKNYAVTNITQASNAVFTIGAHTLVAGDSVHATVASGMTEINGLRGTVQSVTPTTITTDIDSSAFTAFSLASPNTAEINTRPQANETVTCGCYFDIPVRFETDLSGLSYDTKNTDDVVMGLSIRLIELLNV